MKVVFFNRFFAPDASATSQLLSDLAFHLAARGREIAVVASHAPEGPRAIETLQGVTVHRVAAARGEAAGLWARASDYLAYTRAARRAAATLLAPGDIAVIETDPPMLSAAVAGIARARGARTIVWLQDLFPEVASAYRIPGCRGPGGAVLRRMRDRSLAGADAVVAVGDDMAARIAARACVPPERVHVIHNWADGRAIAPDAAGAPALRAEWGLGERFVVGYSGNLGRVHEFETLLGAAAALRDDPGVAFVIVGRGPRRDEVRREAARMALGNVRMEPFRDREALGASLAAADAHVVSLRPEFEGLVQPSKLYGIMAAGRPCLFVGAASGETARILREREAGMAVRPGDSAGLVRAILALRDDPQLRARMGANARRAFEERYDRPLAMGRWERLLGAL